MSIRLELAAVSLTPPSPGLPLLVVGPSLGTSVEALWGRCAALMADSFTVLGWDLPGHGRSRPASRPFEFEDLAAAVMRLVEPVLAGRGAAGGSFTYAGDSAGGAVGLQLMLDFPGRVSAATLLCTGARIGTPEDWQQRAALVRRAGTAAVVDGSRQRWFAPGFADRHPTVAGPLLDDLRSVDAESYALACEALARFDVRARLGETVAPVLAVAGACDARTPVADLRHVAAGVRNGRLVVLEDVAHLAPAEAPERVAELVAADPPDRYAAGMAVRRAVLGAGHVDRATAGITDLTADFQRFITEYAWGSIWTRPGLDRRSRSLITLTALVALGHHDELAVHIRGARNNGLSDDEIKEALLHAAIYCGVPAANAAFRIAKQVMDEDGAR